MQILIKIIISLIVIVAATAIAKKLPSAAGLIGVMPLTGALVLVWVYLENKVIRKPCRTLPRALWGFCRASFSFSWLSSVLKSTFHFPLS